MSADKHRDEVLRAGMALHGPGAYELAMADGYESVGKRELAAEWRAKGEALRGAAQAEAQQAMQELRADWYVFDDAAWPVGKREYRGARNLRSLAIFAALATEVVHGELMVTFDRQNAQRKAESKKYRWEKRNLADKSELPTATVKQWLLDTGYVQWWSKGFGERAVELTPGTVPENCLCQLTKDWVCVRDGKLRASWNPIWEKPRGVNSIWVTA